MQLDSLELDDQFEWTDEFEWSAVEQESERSLGGQLLVQGGGSQRHRGSVARE